MKSENNNAHTSVPRAHRRIPRGHDLHLLSTASRPYRQQEGGAQRAALPLLHFAREMMATFADHGPNHGMRVRTFATQLGSILSLSDREMHYLRLAAFFHDVGNVVNRETHHVVSQETVEKLAARGDLPLDPQEATVVGLVCRWHRKEFDRERVDLVHGEMIRTGFLASILRVADALDIDYHRFDYGPEQFHALEFFFPDKLPFWTSLREILGVRICCKPDVRFQVILQPQVTDNMQVEGLRRDVQATGLPWSVELVHLSAPAPTPVGATVAGGQPRALLVFPFDAHSLVMAATSRKHLRAAGYAVEVLCYPDTAAGTRWLWQTVLPQEDPAEYPLLVLIGERPDAESEPSMHAMAERWRLANGKISILNRHELNWRRLPKLLENNVEIILGGDWAYFWGDQVSAGEVEWGRIGALCTRDPSQRTVMVTAEEQAITKGLLKSVYDVINHPAEHAEEWAKLAEPIMERIEEGDSAFFAGQSAGFDSTYAVPVANCEVHGKVIVFSERPSHLPQGSFWAMEAAIEREGRAAGAGIRFNVPYAIASWPEGETTDLLAISHWRDEFAIPIRLLYPDDLGPNPDGHESTIHVRVPSALAPQIVRALVAACNRRGKAPRVSVIEEERR